MHIWTLWILGSACFLAFYDLAKKASVRGNSVLHVLLCSTLFGCAAFTLGLWGSGRIASVIAAVDSRIVFFATIKALVVAISWIFTFCALRTLPITIATPIRASAPALVFVIAFFSYREVPSWLQGLGMLLVFIGYWVFSWAGKHEGVDFLRSRAVWCAIAGAFFSALSSIWDKYIFQVRAAPVEQVQFFFQIGLVLVYALCLLSRRFLPIHHVNTSFQWRWTIPFVGILLCAADWLYFTGLAIPDVPISVASLMRRFSVALTFVFGAFFFHETNLRRKGIALVLVLSGIALLCWAH